MWLKNTITLNFELFALKPNVMFLKNELMFAIIDSINEELQYCNNHKPPLGNYRKT